MIKSIKNVIVIGATGLVGLELIKQLNNLPNCEKITAVVRHESLILKKMSKVQQFILDDFLLLNDQDVAGYSHAFSCLGTTLKKAGSKDNFYKIDFEINAHFADLFELTETHFLLVSAMGANVDSYFFYNKVKGELERYILQLELAQTSILRPSLLLGDREEARFWEDCTQIVYRKLTRVMPKTFKYKPVTAQQVAHTMVEVAQSQVKKFEIYDNLQIQKMK